MQFRQFVNFLAHQNFMLYGMANNLVNEIISRIDHVKIVVTTLIEQSRITFSSSLMTPSNYGLEHGMS